MKYNDWIKIIILIIFFEAIGFLLGLLTQANIHSWYEGLHKSSLTPPGYIFSIVWSILYALLAVIAWALLENRSNAKIRLLLYLFSIQLIMNWAWTPLFFHLHWIGFSFSWILVLAFINGLIIKNAKTENTTLALAFIPYFLWLLFAAYLNAIIWALN